MQLVRESWKRAEMQGIWRVPEMVTISERKSKTAAAYQTIRASIVIRVDLRFDNSVKKLRYGAVFH